MLLLKKSTNSAAITINYTISQTLRKIKIILKNLPSFEGKLKKLLYLSLITLIYLYHKQKTKFKKFYKKTSLNKKIISHIKPFLKTYSPTLYLPTALQMIYSGSKPSKSDFLIKFEKQKINFQDGGIMNLEWYPLNYTSLPKKTPIIAFILGATGNSKDPYVKAFAKIINFHKWRMVILNRRGFDLKGLETPKFCDRDEMEDFYESLCRVKDIFKAPIYLCGVSAGGNHGAKLLGLYGEKVPVDSFVSISNPYNFARISFNFRFGGWVDYFLSKIITKNLKKIYDFHFKSENFIKRVEGFRNCYDTISDKYDVSDELWTIDKNVTSKLSGHENVLDYYYNLSCEHKLGGITKPSLFLSNLEDPVCYKENLPIDLLYKNENIVTLIVNRGGHIEYFSDLDRKWWAFMLSIHYFKFFEKKRKNLN